MSEALGQNLKAYREAAGFSQTEFSALCNISRQSLHKHETGAIVPTPKNLTRYAQILGISTSELKNKIHPSLRKFQVFDKLIWDKQ